MLTTRNRKDFVIVSIEGNIGSGKTTLLNYIKENTNYCCIEEPVDKWNESNMLQQYYDNPKDRAGLFQIYALFTRCQTIIKSLQENKTSNIFIVDRSIEGDFNAFFELNRNNKNIDDFTAFIYLELYNAMEYLKPNKYVYVMTPPNICHKRIIGRNRNSENKISIEYLKEINDLHVRWFDNIIKSRNSTNEELILYKNYNDESDICNFSLPDLIVDDGVKLIKKLKTILDSKY